MEISRPGDFRVCPSCGARHKVQELTCQRCAASLVGNPIRHAAPVAPRTAGTSTRTLRILAAAGLVLALGTGLMVRSLFRNSALDSSVSAAGRPEAPPGPAVTADGWMPPTLGYPATPPLRPALTHIPPAGEALPGTNGEPLLPAEGMAPSGTPVPGAGETGMVAIAPSAKPSGRTSFDDADLARVRGAAAPAAPPPVRAAGPGADLAREWAERLRDRSSEVEEARARARRHDTDVMTLRARIAGGAVDEDQRDALEEDLRDALHDLEQAERSVRESERRLDEARADARRDGVRGQ